MERRKKEEEEKLQKEIEENEENNKYSEDITGKKRRHSNQIEFKIEEKIIEIDEDYLMENENEKKKSKKFII